MMNRRDALRLLAGGAAWQLAPTPLAASPFAPIKMLAVMREARAVLQDQASHGEITSAPKTLNSHQYATVKTMGELIIPRTETPGAADVGAADFIDLILTEWYEESERSRFLAGLADVDTRSQRLWGKDFVDSTAAQQAVVFNELGEQMSEERDRERSWSNSELRPEEPEENRNFYFNFRQLTLTAYYTSEAGATEELHYEIIPARHAGCVEVKLTEAALHEVTPNQGGPESQ